MENSERVSKKITLSIGSPPSRTSERTLLKKRSCKHCGRNIYLQCLSVTISRPQWVIFDIDGKLHSCPVSPLEPETKQRIQNAIDRMNPVNDYINTTINKNVIETIMRDIDLAIENLNRLRENVRHL